MSFAAIIPARLDSTRLPRKALADLGGKPMIVRVLEKAVASDATRIAAATDSEEIAAAVTKAGFEAVMTGNCTSGTERVARAAKILELDSVVVNLQGDEPDIDPELINKVAKEASDNDCQCVTAAAPLPQDADENIVKVVCDNADKALYFSRSLIPHKPLANDSGAPRLMHVGIYAFAPGRITETLTMAGCALEQAERLEQLRWLWHGWSIKVVTASSYAPGIDTPEELAQAQAKYSDS